MFRRPDITLYNIMLMTGIYLSYHFRDDSDKLQLCITFVIWIAIRLFFAERRKN